MPSDTKLFAPDDPWEPLRRATPARVGLARQGDAPALKDVLDFQLAHARARDAVHAPFDAARVVRDLHPLPTIEVASQAKDRATFLRRPDLGRQLASDAAARLMKTDSDILFVIGDGLSSFAVEKHAAALLKVVLPRLSPWTIAPIVIARQARVALGDAVGERLNAKLCIMLIGERPGLSVSDSLGAYVTYRPREGLKDSARNCISNIHGAGLPYERAADTLRWLVGEALRRQLTGVDLKDDAGGGLLSKPPEAD